MSISLPQFAVLIAETDLKVIAPGHPIVRHCSFPSSATSPQLLPTVVVADLLEGAARYFLKQQLFQQKRKPLPSRETTREVSQKRRSKRDERWRSLAYRQTA